jgi:hypothetical protein
MDEVIPPLELMKVKKGCSRSISGLFQELLVQVQLAYEGIEAKYK